MKRIMLIKQNAGPDDKGEIFPSVTEAAIWLGGKTGENPSLLINRLSIHNSSGSPLLGYFVDEPLSDRSDFFQAAEMASKIYEKRKKSGFLYKSKSTQEFVTELQRASQEKR